MQAELHARHVDLARLLLRAKGDGVLVKAAGKGHFGAVAALLAAGPLMRLIGHKGEAVITRLLGVLLAALAAQFVIDGLKASFPTLT